MSGELLKILNKPLSEIQDITFSMELTSELEDIAEKALLLSFYGMAKVWGEDHKDAATEANEKLEDYRQSQHFSEPHIFDSIPE